MVRGLALFAVLALGACAAAAPAPAPLPDGPVTTQAQLEAVAVGRDLVAEADGTILRISADGSWLERRANHITASGIWDRTATPWCRSGRRDGALFPRLCAVVEDRAGTVTLTDPGGAPRRFRRAG